MKKFLFLNLLALMCFSAHSQGFNLGQMPKFAAIRFNQNGFVPDDFVEEIKKNTPKHRLEYVRFSGTLSNYMNLDFPGAGNSAVAQVENARVPSKPSVSWLECLVETAKQLKCRNVTFTINSHEPYLKRHQLEHSLRSLDYVAKNSNLIAIELENETYFSEEVLGYAGTPNILKKLLLLLKGIDVSDAGVRKRVNEYLDYLEKTVVPAIRARGYAQPLGIGTHINDNQVSKIWNQEVLKRKFYQFVVPHIYTTGYDEVSIKKDFKRYIDDVGIKGKDIRITEYGVQHDKVKTIWQTSSEVENFMLTFEKVCKEYGITHSYLHTYWANGPIDKKGKPVVNFYSYIKHI